MHGPSNSPRRLTGTLAAPILRLAAPFLLAAALAACNGNGGSSDSSGEVYGGGTT